MNKHMSKKRMPAGAAKPYCQESQLNQLLNKYQDNELDAATQKKVSTHLEECPVCRTQLSMMEQVTTRLKALPQLDTNAYFTDQLMAKVNQQNKAKNRWYLRFILPSLTYSLVFLLFLGLGVWAIGVMSGPGIFSNSGEPTPVVQEVDFAQVFSQSQQLSLLHVQDHSFDILSQSRRVSKSTISSTGE